MIKQVHVNLDDEVYNAINTFSEQNKQTITTSISQAIISLTKKQTSEINDYTFIDLFAGIGGMRVQ